MKARAKKLSCVGGLSWCACGVGACVRVGTAQSGLLGVAAGGRGEGRVGEGNLARSISSVGCEGEVADEG